MSRPDRALALIDLDHAPADHNRALIRVLARVGGELGTPADADLLISRSDAAWLSFPARAWTQDVTGAWRGVFAVPAAVVERAEFGFALHTAGHTLPLPHPGFAGLVAPTTLGGLRAPTCRGISAPVGPKLTVEHISRLTGGRVRTRAVALATLLAVTTASSPALALAGQTISAGPSGHAQAAHERIEQLAIFAAERARAQAARKRAASAPGCLHGTAVTASAAREANALTRPVNCATLGPTVTRTSPAPSTSATPAPTTPAPTPPAPVTSAPASPATPATPSPPAPPASSAPPTPPSAPTTAGAGSGGTGLAPGAVPAPVATPPIPSPASPAPAKLTPIAPPRLASSGPERRSRPQLPVTLPSAKGNGGSSRHLHGGHAPIGRHTARPTGGIAPTLTPSPPGFLGPKSWTGTVVNDPSLQGLLGNLSAVLHDINRPPRFLIPIYMEAGRRYHVPWPVLAAINSVETDYGRNLNTSSAGAIGWMQFEPSTWKQWGVAVDGHSVANPYDPRDAIFSAARYLAAAGAGADISRAIYAYNHAAWYVDMVLARARAIGAGVTPHTQTNRHGIITTFFDQWRGRWRAPYRGGYLTHYTRLVASANMVSAADFPYLWGGGHEQPARFGPFDCSGSVSYVLQQAGYRLPTSTSGNVPGWHLPTGPGRVTIFYNATHTFMRIGSRYFGTSTSRPGGGAGWIGTDRLPASYLANFNEVHVPGLRGDAFAAARRQRRAAERRAHATHPAPLRLTPLPAQTSSKLQLTFPAA